MTTDSLERTLEPVRRVCGRVRVPGDKSISHRYALLAALAEGRSCISGYAPGADCRATLECLRDLGVAVRASEGGSADAGATIEIEGRGPHGLQPPARVLDVGNSGTTMRLLAGILAAHAFESTLTGDDSLTRRPMRRVIAPLTEMGAHITAVDGRAPLTIAGGDLRAIDYTPDVPSAQVKSAVLLAGLLAAGTTTVRERVATRNHTELALAAFGARVDRVGRIAVAGGQRLSARRLGVPGDLSSAGFWAAAAAALPGSELELIDVGLNPTRTALLAVLRRMGAHVETVQTEGEPGSSGEPRGTIRIRHGPLRPITIAPAEVPGLIDELPLLAALATHGGGITVTGAAELRAKESDRITALVTGLRSLGADAEESRDGFCVRGDRRLRGGRAESAGDHRLAMALAIAGLGAAGPSLILGADAVEVSYPTFFEVLGSIAE